MDNLFDSAKRAGDIKQLHLHAKQLLTVWLNYPPTDQRQIQALMLLANAILALQAAARNLND
jgi:hypothetical protein